MKLGACTSLRNRDDVYSFHGPPGTFSERDFPVLIEDGFVAGILNGA